MPESTLTSLPGMAGCRQCHTLWEQLCQEQKRHRELQQQVRGLLDLLNLYPHIMTPLRTVAGATVRAIEEGMRA